MCDHLPQYVSEYVSDILNVIYSKVLCMQQQNFVFKREQLHECCKGENMEQ